MSLLSPLDSSPSVSPSDSSSLEPSLDSEDSISSIIPWIASGMSLLSPLDSSPSVPPPVMMVILEPESPSFVIVVPVPESLVFEVESNPASLPSLSRSAFSWPARVLTPAASISSTQASCSTATLTDQAPVSINPNVVWTNSL